MYLSDDYQMPKEEEGYTYAFPLSVKALDAYGEIAMQKPYYIDGTTGQKEYYSESYFDSSLGEQVDIECISADRLEYAKSCVRKADHLMNYDSSIIKLVSEEAEAYFNGQKTLDEVASVVQSRVSIYVRENQ